MSHQFYLYTSLAILMASKVDVDEGWAVVDQLFLVDSWRKKLGHRVNAEKLVQK